MSANYYIYRFIDYEDAVIYVGITNNLTRRMEIEHFTDRAHLPKTCYKQVKSIEYSEVCTENDARVLEIILISKYRPKYNTEYNNSTITFFKEMPQLYWAEYKRKTLKTKTDVANRVLQILSGCNEVTSDYLIGELDIDHFNLISLLRSKQVRSYLKKNNISVNLDGTIIKKVSPSVKRQSRDTAKESKPICAVCGIPIVRKSNRQKYCESCGVTMEREHRKERDRFYKSKKRRTLGSESA